MIGTRVHLVAIGRTFYFLTKATRTAVIPLFASTAATSAAPFTGPFGSVTGITYEVDSVNPPGGPTFGPSGEIRNINSLTGGGYGSLGNPITPVNQFGGGIANPSAPFGGPPGSFFSASQPPVPAVGFGNQRDSRATLTAELFDGGYSAGILWANGLANSIADSGPPDGSASANFSRGIATFGDPQGDLALGAVWFGERVSSPVGGLSASTLLGNFTVFDAFGRQQGGPISASVDIFYNGFEPPSVTSTSPICDRVNGGPACFLSDVEPIGFDPVRGTTFFAFGIQYIPFIQIPAGGSVRIDGTLSLVADPDALVELAPIPSTVPLAPLRVGNIPEAIPEPSSYGLLGLGLTVLALLGFLRHRRREPPQPLPLC